MPNNIEVIKLSANHHLDSFSCGNRDINRFLKREALRDQINKHSTTYVLVHKGDEPTNVWAYITLACGTLTVGEMEKQRFPDYRYSETSAVLIARLGRDLRCKNRGYGKILMNVAINLINEMSNKIGCRAIVVDSYVHKIKYYESLGFEVCSEEKQEIDGPKRYQTMWYDLLSAQ